jgi:hypothetical protein
LQQFRQIILEREGPDCLASQVCREPRAISVPGSTFFEWGMLIEDGEEGTFKE